MDGKDISEYVIDNSRISTFNANVPSSKNKETFEAVSPLRASMSPHQNDNSVGQVSVRSSAVESVRLPHRRSSHKFDEVFGRNVSFFNDEVDVISRAMTSIIGYIDPNLEISQAIINNVAKHERDGTEGDHPFPRGFARKTEFWKLIFVSGVMAVVLAFATVAFTSCIDNVPPEWASCEYGVDQSCGNWYTGQLYWIPLSGGAGLLVGLLRYFFSYPDNLPGFFREIQDAHVNPRWVCLTYIISAISLSGGATLGPEQALGNVGGGLATFLLENFVSFEEEFYRRMFVLSGIVAPLGALLPNPMLGVTLIMELGDNSASYIESIMILAIPATISFSVYFGMIGYAYLDYISSTSINLSQEWVDDPGFKGYMIMTGFAIGCVSAALCLTTMIITGICRQFFNRLRLLLSFNSFLKSVVPPVIGGIAIGAVNWALPGTVGNGKLVFAWIVKYGAVENPLISQKLLVCTGFARMFLLGVSLNCGFIGGIIFPFLTIGLIAGAVMSQMYPYLPVLLCITTFMVAIPCAFVPVPITFSVLAASTFFLGAYESIPIFVAIFTGYTILSGSGFMKKMAVESMLRENKMNEGWGKNATATTTTTNNNNTTNTNNNTTNRDTYASNVNGNAAENMS